MKNNNGFWTEMERLPAESPGVPLGVFRGLGYAVLFAVLFGLVVLGFVL